jgi:hypothetical protein
MMSIIIIARGPVAIRSTAWRTAVGNAYTIIYYRFQTQTYTHTHTHTAMIDAIIDT